jgi:hypothetical protein
MLGRTNVLHLRTQLNHFTYLTQFVRLCVLYIIFCITYYGIYYITFYVSLYNNCSPKIKCVISSLFIWLAFISSYLFIGLMAIFWTILVDSFSDSILFGDDNDISPGDSVTIRNVNRKLTNGPCKAKEARSGCKGGKEVSAGPPPGNPSLVQKCLRTSVPRTWFCRRTRRNDETVRQNFGPQGVLSDDTTEPKNCACDKLKVLIVFPGTLMIMGQVHKKTVGRYILISYDFSIKLLHWSFVVTHFFP